MVRDERDHSWELLGSAKSALEAVEIRCLHLETIRTGKREINQCLVVALLELFRPGGAGEREGCQEVRDRQHRLRERAESLFS